MSHIIKSSVVGDSGDSQKKFTVSAIGYDDGDGDDNSTPKAPRGKRSDLTEKDLEIFIQSFGALMSDG
jgi:hypothetical protein